MRGKKYIYFEPKPIPTWSSGLNFTAEQQDQGKNNYFLIEFQHVFLLIGKAKLNTWTSVKYSCCLWNKDKVTKNLKFHFSFVHIFLRKNKKYCIKMIESSKQISNELIEKFDISYDLKRMQSRYDKYKFKGFLFKVHWF